MRMMSVRVLTAMLAMLGGVMTAGGGFTALALAEEAPTAAPDAVTIPAAAPTGTEFLLTVKKGGGFEPTTLEVPAGQKVKVTVRNEGATEAEFESYTLKREEKIAPGAATEIFVGPLDAGSYEFFDDNNPEAKGTLTAR